MTPLPDAPRVFISKSTSDLQIAWALVAMLEAQGMRTWISERDLPASTSYAEDLVTALEDCQAILLVVSDAALASSDVFKEIDKASHLRRPVFTVAAPGYAFPGRANLPKGWDYHIGGGNMQTDGNLTAVVAACRDALIHDETTVEPPRFFHVATNSPRGFVGQSRARIVAELKADWEEVRDSRQARLVVLMAESGFGKTRIVQEFYRRVACAQDGPGFWPSDLIAQINVGNRGLRESRKRVSPALLDPPPDAHASYLWLGHAVDEGLGGRVDHGLLGLSEELARALDLAARAEPAGPAARMVDHAFTDHPSPGQDLRAAVMELLHRGDLSADSGVIPGSVEAFWQGVRRLWGTPDSLPTIIAIEDGHFAGQETVAALEQLASSQQLPFLVVICAQESQLTTAPDSSVSLDRRPLGRLLDEGVVGVGVRHVDRLTDDEISAVYLEAIPDLDQGTLGAAVRKVDGNPYYAHTLLVAMIEVAATGKLNATWVENRPSRFEDELRLQWEDLAPEVRRALSGLAVLGTQVPERLGTRALNAGAKADQSGALSASVTSGWLRRLPRAEALRFLERPRWVIARDGAAYEWDPSDRTRIITEALLILETIAETTGLNDQLLLSLHIALALAADREHLVFNRSLAVRSGLEFTMRLRLTADDSGSLSVARDVESLVRGHEHEPGLGPLAVESALSLKGALRAATPQGAIKPETVAAATLAVHRAQYIAEQRPDLAARAFAARSRTNRVRASEQRMESADLDMAAALSYFDKVAIPDATTKAEVTHARALQAKSYGDTATGALYARQRLEVLEAAYGPLDRRVTIALDALSYYATRLNLDEGIVMREEFLQRRLRAWGDSNHVQVAIAQKEVAFGLVREWSQTRLAEARSLADESLATMIRLRGAGHNSATMSRSVLVLVCCRSGDAQELRAPHLARELWEKALHEAVLAANATPANAPESTLMVRARRKAEALLRIGNRDALVTLEAVLRKQEQYRQPAPGVAREIDTLWTVAELVAGYLRFQEELKAQALAARYGLLREERFPEFQPRGWRSSDPRHARAGVL